MAGKWPSSDQTTEMDPRTSPVSAAQLAAADDFFLVVRFEDDTPMRVVELAIGDGVTIGRAESAAIRADGPRVSREHARIERRADGLFVRDLGSRNGTWLGKDRLHGVERALAAGDVVAVPPVSVVVASASRRAPIDASPQKDGGANAGDDLDDLDGATAGFIVADAAMIAVYDVVKRLALLTTTVLVLGETGVGKEVVAGELHRRSPRAAGPFVSLSCAALPEALAEAELFGHEKGAFTGADRKKIGFIEAADHGTLLLDEVGELTPSLQAKLLRVLETRKLTRLGSTQEIAVDVRIVSATCRDLAADVASGKFRQDLFFRLSAFCLEVPPLRERPAEIALLASLFARRFAETTKEKPRAFSAEATRVLQTYAWPGNVRELANAVEHALVIATGAEISPVDLPATVRKATNVKPAAGARAAPPEKMNDRVLDVERRAIEEALAACSGNRTKTAARLGISRRALIYKLAKHGLS